MPQYADCYFLVNHRDKKFAEAFLDRFLPNREVLEEEFLNSDIACITIEEVAPSNSTEFREFCSQRFVP